MKRSIALAALAAAATLPAAATSASAKVPKGPSGAAFYTPPAKVAGKHGTLLRARKLTGPAAPGGGSGTELLLYRSTGIAGKSVAVSGTITYPKGKAPKGGWPVITYAHGTTGIADQCAPSRLTDDALQGPTTYAYPLIARWLKAGWAVTRTDYEGLGTPGTHPYGAGTSEGRATLDAALAAPKVNRKRVIISGHSQGGQAALWANSLAPKYAPGLKIRGTVAFAPVTHFGEQAPAIQALTTPSGLSGLVALILRGAEVQTPSLDSASLLNPEPAALFPRTETDCLIPLDSGDSFGGIAPADLLKPYADLSDLLKALSQNDAEDVAIHGKLRIQQGADDGTVFPAFTDQTVDEYKQKGYSVEYDRRPGLNHGQIVTDTASQKAATKWIAKRLK